MLFRSRQNQVGLALEAGRRLATVERRVRVISLPSFELFERQEPAWRESVLPAACRRRVAIEAASPFGWHRWVGEAGTVIGMDGFGASAPAADLARKFGFTVDAVVARVEALGGG